MVTPAHAKRLLAALADNIQRYEAQHGAIHEAANPGASVQFSGPGGEA